MCLVKEHTIAAGADIERDGFVNTAGGVANAFGDPQAQGFADLVHGAEVLPQPINRFIVAEIKGVHGVPVLVAPVTDETHGIGVVGYTKVVVSLSAAAGYLVSIPVMEFDPKISLVDAKG